MHYPHPRTRQKINTNGYPPPPLGYFQLKIYFGFKPLMDAGLTTFWTQLATFNRANPYPEPQQIFAR